MRFCNFSDAFARAGSRRPQARRSMHQFTPVMLDRLESRVVLSAVDPVLAKPFIQFTPLADAEFIEDHDGLVNEVCITVGLKPSKQAEFFATFGADATVDVGFVSYLMYGGEGAQFDLRDQVYLDSASTTLSADNLSDELCVATDDFHCVQIDLFTGEVVYQFTLDGRAPGYHDYSLNDEGQVDPSRNRLIQGALVSPSGMIMTAPPGSMTPEWQDIAITHCEPDQSGEGLTAGYWKNHLND